MGTRRRFIASSLMGVVGGALWSRIGSAGASPLWSPAGSSNSPADRDFWNDWPAYITRQMKAARERRLAQLAEVKTSAQAQERAAKIRESLWEILGGPLEKTPLNAKITHTRDRGYCRIETLIFESVPNVYVTANLYLPTLPSAGKPPYPAILAPVGHANNGKAYASYQHFFQNLARQGFVVLTYDPWGQGERFQYPDAATGKSRFGATGEHTQAGRPMILMGDGVARYLAWDGIRALDYLITRPEADPERIGCAGHSGGGTMTEYLSALEPRIRVAAAIEGNTENLAGALFDPPGAIDDAEQNIVGGLRVGLDRGDLLYTFAPKPLLICYTTHDVGETYSPALVEDTDELYRDLEHVYGLFGKAENLSLFADRLPHELDYFDRRAAYKWLCKWLKGEPEPPEEAALDVFPEDQLNATETGQVLATPGCRSAVQVNVDRMAQLLPKSPFLDSSKTAAEIHLSMLSDVLRLLAIPDKQPGLESKTLSTNTRRDVRIEEVELHTDREIRIPAWFASRSGDSSRRPVVLLVAENGGEDIVDDPGSMDRLLAAGYAVFSVTLRGLGIAMPRSPASAPQYFGDTDRIYDGLAWDSLALGLPAIGQRVTDVWRAIDYLAARPDVDPTQIRVIGRGDAGLAAQFAAFLDSRIRSLLLDRTLLTYASIVESIDYSIRVGWFVPAILRHFDLPDVCAAMAPRSCWLLNAADPNGNALSEASARETYRRRIGAAAHVHFLTAKTADHQEAYLEWVRNS